MTFELTGDGEMRLERYFEEIGKLLGDRRRRASFAQYAMGVIGEHERKSTEPLTAAAASTPEEAARLHDHLLHFVGQSDWDDIAVRRFAAKYALESTTSREPVRAWIIDDTGFLKQGKHSPGVQRQYTGSAGKKANCQIGVSLTVSTDTEHVPVDMQLYLPESWTSDRARCRRAKIPDEVVYRPKWKIALRMMDDAKRAGIPVGVALAGAAYGNVSAFRTGLQLLGFEYAVGINSTTVVTPASAVFGTAKEPIAVSALAKALPRRAYRHTTWRQGSRRAMVSRFALMKVDVKDEGQMWLLIEWPEGDNEPSHFTLGNFKKPMSRKQVVRITKERWRTERVYQDLKSELGLDHYEGRSYRGWNHHVTVVFSCFAFILNERMRRFPPSRRRESADGSIGRAA